MSGWDLRWVVHGLLKTTVSDCQEGVGECGGPECLLCEGFVNVNVQRTVSFPGHLYEATHRLCLWWDSPPVDFKLLGPCDTYEPYADIYGWDGSDSTKTRFSFIGDEAISQAKTNADTVGLDPDEVITGYMSIHGMGSSDWTQIKRILGGTHPQIWNLVKNGEDFKVLHFEDSNRTYQQGFYLGIYEWDDEAEGYLWNGDDAMEQCFKHAYYSSFYECEWGYTVKDFDIEADNFGLLGVGISPNKAGTLCAVIRIGAKVFYVWRNTDEEFTERSINVAGPAGKPNVEFFGRTPTEYGDHFGSWDMWAHFGSTGRKLESILKDKHVEYAKPNDVGMTRLTGQAAEEQDVATWITNDSSVGKVDLEMPVWLIASKSRVNSKTEFPKERTRWVAEHGREIQQYP